MKHIPVHCMVAGCKDEASYWIDAEEGFLETLMGITAPKTFYVCVDHMNDLQNEEDGNYHHLRIDTGEVFVFEFAKYCCNGCEPDCCPVCDS